MDKAFVYTIIFTLGYPNFPFFFHDMVLARQTVHSHSYQNPYKMETVSCHQLGFQDIGPRIDPQ